MYIDEFRDYCLSKKAVTESTPFGPQTLVLRAMGKIFAITGIDTFEFVKDWVQEKVQAVYNEEFGD